MPPGIVERTHEVIGEVMVSELERRDKQDRVDRLQAEELERAMREGYESESAEPSLDEAWDVTEVEGWD